MTNQSSNQVTYVGEVAPFHAISPGPTIPESDPLNIRRELVQRVDKLAEVRARKTEAVAAVAGARAILDRARADAQAADAAVRDIERRELAEIEALANASDADTAARRLAATRSERGQAVATAESARQALALASGASNGPTSALDGLIADEQRYVREIDMWRARAAAHPLPAPTPIEASTIPTFADSVAAANNYPSAREMARSQLLASLPVDVRTAVEADAPQLDACLALVASGDVNGAIGAAYAHAATRKAKK